MSDNANSIAGSILTLGTFLVFTHLKIDEHVDWSWWIVTCPLWGPFALGIGVFAAIVAAAIVACLMALVFATIFGAYGAIFGRPQC